MISRMQRTMTNNIMLSDMLAVSCGVPQGSILVPFLFLVYVRGMAQLKVVVSYLQMIPQDIQPGKFETRGHCPTI